jgi:hypothetical protein
LQLQELAVRRQERLVRFQSAQPGADITIGTPI